MRDLFVMIAVIVLCTGLGACSSGGGVDPVPDPSDVLAVTAGDALRIHAGPGSADAGTIARILSGAAGQATVAVDGGFTFDATAAGAMQGAFITVEYTKQGVTLNSDVMVATLAGRVTKPLFSTGSAPNDMLLRNDSLYIANSMDNTVVRYGLDGAELAAAAFSEYASPSYLGVSDSMLWVLTNGDNLLTGLDPLSLAATVSDISLTTGLDPLPAFPGPGAPACRGTEVYIPLAMIQSFGETTGYGDAAVLSYDDAADFPGTAIHRTLSGRNGKAAAFNPLNGDLLVTSSGEMQFDEFWSPFVTTDSYLDIYTPAGGHTAVNLGATGTGSIAVSPDGAVAYVGNALSGNLYKVNLATSVVERGADNPIVLTADYTFLSDLAFTPDGRYLLVASYNTDELYVVDPATDTVSPGPYPAPFDLSLDPELLAGCLGVEVSPVADAAGSYQAYVLYGIANAVAEVKLF